ncbi:hypothetical protein BD311DRAFT_675869 [Dichomitus squalens]|uniref:Uncharacterized protein n=1 Tax=Dichomitus squalens TaxID=114155 RepID=A0A4Q9M9Z8_9APHY|nr:hypothetical protein BD311DRAFT_675869 [Dichomitus squalens]
MCYTRLSVEVIEMVVDQLSDDVPSLRTVALVCRGLLPRARYNLFVDIGVRNKNQMNTLREFLDERPYICPLVQCVTLSTTDGEPNSFTLLETIPVPLLTRLPNLRRWRATNQSLDFKGQHWLSLNHSTLASLRKYTANISHLSINALSFSGCMDFVRFVSAFLHKSQVRRDVSEAAVASLLEISKLTLRELVLVVTRQQSNSPLAEQLSQLDSLTLSMPVDPHLETFVRSVWGIAAFFKYLSTMLPLQEIRVECYGSSFWALDAMLSQQGTSEACQQLEQVLLAVPRHSMQFRIVGGGRGSKPLKGNLRNMALKKRFRTLWKKGAIRVELPRCEHEDCVVNINQTNHPFSRQQRTPHMPRRRLREGIAVP